jgi:hypothetical protein
VNPVVSREQGRFRPIVAACLLVVVAAFVGVVTGGVEAKDPKRPRLGPMITIHSPEPRQLELALDEMELDWSHDPGARARGPAQAAQEVHGARLAARDGVRAIYTLSGVSDKAALRAMAASLSGANPGAEPLVLGREVSLLLKPGETAAAVLAGQSVGAIRQVPGVPGGFVVEARDPLDALDLADTLRAHPAVTSATPIVRRMFFPR